MPTLHRAGRTVTVTAMVFLALNGAATVATAGPENDRQPTPALVCDGNVAPRAGVCPETGLTMGGAPRQGGHHSGGLLGALRDVVSGLTGGLL